VVSLESKTRCWGAFAVLALPEIDEAEDLVGLLALANIEVVPVV
jgi:hypothetical protein